MILLAIETATVQVGCALAVDGEVVATHEVARGRRHAENLVPAIGFLCKQAGIDLAELSGIAVDIGPGLFTGMRVGIATAKTMARALSVPVVPVCSLDVLAYPLRLGDRMIASVVDARRGELYHALYRPIGEGCQRIGEPAVSSPDDVIADLLEAEADLILVGDGALVARERFLADVPRAQMADEAPRHPSAAVLARVATPLMLTGATCDADAVEPMYLRRPDAEINWTTRDRAGSAS